MSKFIRMDTEDYVDRDMKPVLRSPLYNRFSYSNYLLWKRRGYVVGEKLICEWTDRLKHWDTDLFNKAATEAFGNTGNVWSDRDPESIEVFLRFYFDDPTLELVLVEQGCNFSTGYPVWVLSYRKVKNNE